VQPPAQELAPGAEDVWLKPSLHLQTVSVVAVQASSGVTTCELESQAVQVEHAAEPAETE